MSAQLPVSVFLLSHLRPTNENQMLTTIVMIGWQTVVCVVIICPCDTIACVYVHVIQVIVARP